MKIVEMLVTDYTRGGSTERLAQAVADGVRSAGGSATLKPVDEVDASDLPGYDGIIYAHRSTSERWQQRSRN